MASPGRYNVLKDVGSANNEGYVSLDPYAIVAVIRLGLPLSFSRITMSSVTKDVTQGALLRSVHPLTITDDVLSLQTQSSKNSHVKSMNVSLKSSSVNYLNEVLPGDWVFAWLVSSRSKFDDIVTRINIGQACNNHDDGLKFVGRVHSVRKQMNIDGQSGTKTSNYTLQCSGMSELDACLFYDNTFASADQKDQSFGSWLPRLGLNYEELFGAATKDGIKKDNCGIIFSTLIDLIIGKGPPNKSESGVKINTPSGTEVGVLPQTLSEPPFAYLIPVMAAQLLGVEPSDGSKASHVMSYADILELLQGIQTYSQTSGIGMFTPDLSSSSTGRHRFTPDPVHGTFLPYMLEFTNKPLFQLLHQYSNPAINEMYATLRVNPEGSIMPTLVFRQIPFTTDALPVVSTPVEGPTLSGGALPNMTGLQVTRFLSLPRWVIPDVMIESLDVGRSDATRVNFVSIYGSSSLVQNNVSPQYQLVQNPPIRDDLDIQRSGLKSYIMTADVWLSDQVGKSPSEWSHLVADRMINSHLTLNGTIYSYGIQSAITEGDNLEVSDTVFHIESVAHNFSINPMGVKSFKTVLQLTNGMRASVPKVQNSTVNFPIYPGFIQGDMTQFDPGLTLEHVATTGDASSPEGVVDDRLPKSNSDTATLLNPEATEPPRQFGDFDHNPET